MTIMDFLTAVKTSLPFTLTQAEAAWTVAAGAGAVLLVWTSRIKTILTAIRKVCSGTVVFVTFPYIMQRRMDATDAKLGARLDAQDARLEAITKELTPNGGKSIKDVLGQIRDIGMLNALRTRQMIMTHSVAIYECEPAHGQCTTANRALCELFGLSEKEMEGNGWTKSIVAKDRQACWDGYQKALASDIPYDWCYEVENQRTHERFRCRTEMVVLRDLHGKALAYQGIVERIADEQC